MDLKILQQAKAIESKIQDLYKQIEGIENILESGITRASFNLNGYLNLDISKEYAEQIAQEYLDARQKELKKLQRDLSEL